MAIESHMNDPTLSALQLMSQRLEEESQRRRAAMRAATDNVLQGMQQQQAETETERGREIQRMSQDLYGPEGEAFVRERQTQRGAQAAGRGAYDASRLESGAPRNMEGGRATDRDGIVTMSSVEMAEPPADPTLGGTVMDPEDEAFDEQVNAFADVHAAGGGDPRAGVAVTDPEKARLLAGIQGGADAHVAGIQNAGPFTPEMAASVRQVNPVMTPDKAALIRDLGAGADAHVAGINNPTAGAPPRDPNRDAILAQIAAAQAGGIRGAESAFDNAMVPYPVTSPPAGLPLPPGAVPPPQAFSAEDYARYRLQGGR